MFTEIYMRNETFIHRISPVISDNLRRRLDKNIVSFTEPWKCVTRVSRSKSALLHY
jgi:hypothetical protein